MKKTFLVLMLSFLLVSLGIAANKLFDEVLKENIEKSVEEKVENQEVSVDENINTGIILESQYIQNELLNDIEQDKDDYKIEKELEYIENRDKILENFDLLSKKYYSEEHKGTLEKDKDKIEEILLLIMQDLNKLNNEDLVSYLAEKNIFPSFDFDKSTSDLKDKYIEIFKEYFYNYMLYGIASYSELEEADILTSNKHKVTIIELFKAGVLPSSFYEKIGELEIYYTAPYFLYNNYNQENFSCGNYWSPGGGDLSGSCIVIIKDKENYYINTSNKLGRFVNEYKKSYLLFKNKNFCGGTYSLTDRKLNIVGNIKFSELDCNDYSISFTKSNKTVSIIDYSKDNNLEMLKYYSDDNLLHQIVYMDGVKNNFDIAENILLDGFKINDDIIIKDQFDNNSKINDIERTYLSLKYNTDGKSEYELEGVFESDLTGGYNNINKIEILSCKDNSTIYDNNRYNLKKYDEKSRKFIYRISNEFGNKCSIPYKFRYYYGDKFIETQYNLVFNN